MDAKHLDVDARLDAKIKSLEETESKANKVIVISVLTCILSLLAWTSTSSLFWVSMIAAWLALCVTLLSLQRIAMCKSIKGCVKKEEDDEEERVCEPT